MKKNLKLLIPFPMNKIAWLCALMWISGTVGYSCMAMDPAAILPDIPQIAWRDLTQGRLIGRGGFGDVHEGQWKGQEVAIKKLHMHALPNATVKRDFDDEVRVMWGSQYPRIVRLYGVCEEPGNCAMVMERMQRSLHDLIHSAEEVTDAKRLQVAIDIAQGLASLHAQKILHRDLKSQNILLDKRDRGKISDFGLAKIRVHTKSTTKMGNATGTVRWGAPEVFALKPKTTTASDMYSYGMVLWELLTRQIPFAEQPDDTVVVVAVKGGEREEIPEGCHPVWREVIQGCWEQSPEKRPTADEALSRFMSLKSPQRPRWLPEEDPQAPIRAEGYVRQPASGSDWELVLRAYTPHPVPGYDIGRVEVIFNPSMNAGFKAQCNLLQQRQGNPRYAASWRQSSDGEARAKVARHLEALTAPYQDEDYPDVKLMPLWHGTQRDKLGSLLSAGYGAFGDTDSGYFGKGIYASFEAAYAQMYADKGGLPGSMDGVLVFNWGITYNSLPLIKPDYNQVLKRLAWAPDTASYDSHFVPVVHLSGYDYIPASPQETPQFTEMVFFNASQILPRYVVTLQPTLPNSPMAPMSQTPVLLEALKEQQKGAGLADQKIAPLKEKKVEELEAAKLALAQQNIDLEKQLTELQREKQERERKKAEEREAAQLERKAAAERQAREAAEQQIRLANERQIREAAERERVLQAQRAAEAERIRLSVPLAAQGHEAVYQRFLNGVLIYRPDGKSDNGRINLRISDLVNPLEGTFDLSRCGDAGKYLSISTGYRKGKKAENKDKVEIWFAPRFLVEKEINTTAKHLSAIFPSKWAIFSSKWPESAPVGMIWTWGSWDSMDCYDYLTNENMDNLSKINLYENWQKSEMRRLREAHMRARISAEWHFHVHFVN